MCCTYLDLAELQGPAFQVPAELRHRFQAGAKAGSRHMPMWPVWPMWMSDVFSVAQLCASGQELGKWRPTT